MKKIILSVLLLSCLLPLSATHLLQGNFHYKYKETNANGDLVYQVTLELVRDCSSQTNKPLRFDNNITVGLYKLDNGKYILDQSINMSLGGESKIQGRGVHTKPDSTVCLWRGFYEKEITLKSTIASYYLAWTRCCRYGSDNLTNAANNGNLFYVNINTGSTSQNVSPYVEDESPLIMNAATHFVTSLANIDEDGDSLSYHWVNAINEGDPNEPIPSPKNEIFPPFTQAGYVNGYSVNAQLGTTNSYTILDSIRGTLYAKAASVGRYTLSYEVREWRGGTLIGSYYREKMVIVLANNQSQLEKIDLLANAPDIKKKRIGVLWSHTLQGAVTSFTLERRRMDSTSWNTIAVLDSMTTSYVDTNIEFDFYYFYKVTASSGANPTSNLDSTIVRNKTLSAQNIPQYSIAIYPNPSNDRVYVSTAPDVKITKAQLIDITGKVITTIKGEDVSEGISVKGLPQGIYLIKIYDGSTVLTERVSVY